MLIPVILSGGAGTRLWPVSREAHPKPFMKLPDGESLLLKTARRATALDNVREVWTITNRDYYFITKDEYDLLGEDDKVMRHFLLEPSGRNTAPAVALAALTLAERHGQDAVMLVLPADHLIEKNENFRTSIARAYSLAKAGYLVTFGIIPGYPETGYGYIECGELLEDGYSMIVSTFQEKPSVEKAREFVASGRHLWNSGMFCFQVGTFLEELRSCAPQLYEGAEACYRASQAGGGMELDRETFATLPNISVDYAVMEKARKVAVVPGDLGWSDIGSWSAVAGLAPSDNQGNRSSGEVVLVGSRDCYVRSEDRLVGVVGGDNLIVVDTPDALLVAHKNHCQDVKQIVSRLKEDGHEAYRLHRTVHRPWGTYTILENGKGFKIKRIVVKPEASLSMQMHYHRSEHWVVVSGTAKVVNGEKEYLVRTNESTYIPSGQRHRLTNPGLVDLVMIEVQSGEYLEEDDIVRFDDKYGRG